ncbi:TetR/AcrR family transcriptional regulator [Pseudonocardia parietis]|uniref:TetR/AcrR family transcriptional regulator n=1 Tax=Pseudonocardia parietis TaxID=570936 RepID=UPI001AE8D905|nr:TetR/AcrR family transcriptional regulator [Pseudonocardia parietis]
MFELMGAGSEQMASGGPRRADARRNIDAIVEAAVDCLGRRPEASVADVAKEAGVGRVTVYGHFPSRAELVDAAVVHVLEQVDVALKSVDLHGPPREALARYIRASWEHTGRSLSLVAAAEKELASERIHRLHERLAERPVRVLERGQADGVFSDDLPISWMVAVLHRLIHGAADEVGRANIHPSDAAELIVTTVLRAFAPGRVEV